MSETKSVVRYDYNYLQQYCKENGIELLKDYSTEKVNRRLCIEAKCLMENCNNICSKDFRNFVKNGCYCISCIYLKNNKIKYDYNYLQQYCKEYGIELLKDYVNKKVNRDTIFEANCLIDECVNNVEKSFRCVVEYGGCYCETHIKETQYEKAKISDWNNSNRVRYNTKYFMNYCKENKIVLTKNYNDISVNRETVIEAFCLIDGCVNNVKKSFRCIVEYGGCYCVVCTETIRMDKIKTTSLEKYGVENAQQNSEVAEKSSKKCV